MTRDVRLVTCPGCTEDYPASWFIGRVCPVCAYGGPAMAVVRGAGGFRRQEARFIGDDELAEAVDWWWQENQPPAGTNRVYWTRPKLARIARVWIRRHQPAHAALVERAYKASARERQRALREGCSEEESEHRSRLAWDAAVRRAVNDDAEILEELRRYWPLRTGERADMSRAALHDVYGMPAVASKRTAPVKDARVTITRVEPGDAHRMEDCPDTSACRWHAPRFEVEKRRRLQFLSLVMNTHAHDCPKCSGPSVDDATMERWRAQRHSVNQCAEWCAKVAAELGREHVECPWHSDARQLEPTLPRYAVRKDGRRNAYLVRDDDLPPGRVFAPDAA